MLTVKFQHAGLGEGADRVVSFTGTNPLYVSHLHAERGDSAVTATFVVMCRDVLCRKAGLLWKIPPSVIATLIRTQQFLRIDMLYRSVVYLSCITMTYLPLMRFWW